MGFFPLNQLVLLGSCLFRRLWPLLQKVCCVHIVHVRTVLWKPQPMEWQESRFSFPTLKISVIESRRTRKLKALEFCNKSLESGKVEWIKRARQYCTMMWRKMKVVNVDENESCICCLSESHARKVWKGAKVEWKVNELRKQELHCTVMWRKVKVVNEHDLFVMKVKIMKESESCECKWKLFLWMGVKVVYPIGSQSSSVRLKRRIWGVLADRVALKLSTNFKLEFLTNENEHFI